MKEESGIQFRKLLQWGCSMCINRSSKSQGEHEGPLPSLSMQHAEPPVQQAADPSGGQPSPSQPCTSDQLHNPHHTYLCHLILVSSNTKAECIRYRNRLHIHGGPVAQTPRRPRSPRNTPLQWLPRPGSGDRPMGSNFYNVSGGKPLDQLWGLKKVKTGGKISKQSNKKTAWLASLECPTLVNPFRLNLSGGCTAGLPRPTEQHQAGASMCRMACSDLSCTGNVQLQVKSAHLPSSPQVSHLLLPGPKVKWLYSL